MAVSIGGMTCKCSVFIAASVDGFIARADGDVQWLMDPVYKLPEEHDFGYTPFMADVDALVMGRKSFEKVLTFDPWPYPKPVVVLTTGEPTIPEALHDQVTLDRGTPAEVVARQAAMGRRHLYIDGGITIQQFLLAGLIDQMIITQIPILLGGGIPLFGSIGAERALRHVETKPYANGFVQTRYALSKP